MSPMTFRRCEGHPPEYSPTRTVKVPVASTLAFNLRCKGRGVRLLMVLKWKTLGHCTNSVINPYRESCFNVGTYDSKDSDTNSVQQTFIQIWYKILKGNPRCSCSVLHDEFEKGWWFVVIISSSKTVISIANSPFSESLTLAIWCNF